MALQRLYDRFAAEGLSASRLAFGRELAMVAEHTCGVDIKSYLRDDKAWSRPDFEVARKGDYRFAYAEQSWQEQRDYLDKAVSMLEPEDAVLATDAVSALSAPALPVISGREMVLKTGGWTVTLDGQSGDIASIATPAGTVIPGRGGALLGYRYESYDAADVGRHMDTYLTHRQEWAVLDHDKPGLGQSGAALSQVFSPVLEAAAGNMMLLSLPERASSSYGAPKHVSLRFLDEGNALSIQLTLHAKPANRMPEASFFFVTPAGDAEWSFRKMGLWHKSGAIAESGGAQLQAVSAARTGALQIEPLDTPLAAPASWDFMTFCKARPDFSGGIRFNLHNNKWGTNFPMWCEGDIIARFRLSEI